MRAMFRSIAMGLLLLANAMPVSAQSDFPNRPVKIVVPFPAGGPTDGMARIVSDRLSTVLGQSVVVENKGGGVVQYLPLPELRRTQSASPQAGAGGN